MTSAKPTNSADDAVPVFDPVSFTKVFKKIILSAFLLFIIVLSFVLYLNYEAARARLLASAGNAFSERTLSLDSSIYSTVKHVKIMKSVADRSLSEWNEKKTP